MKKRSNALCQSRTVLFAAASLIEAILPSSCGARRALIFMLFAAFMLGNASAQQTINYTNGENNTSNIVITTATDPTTLSLSSGTAAQGADIRESGTTGDLDGNARSGNSTLTNANTYIHHAGGSL